LTVWLKYRGEELMGRFIAEFVEFLRHRKKYWLIPILLALLFFGGLVVFTKGTAVAPFIYTLF